MKNEPLKVDQMEDRSITVNLNELCCQPFLWLFAHFIEEVALVSGYPLLIIHPYEP